MSATTVVGVSASEPETVAVFDIQNRDVPGFGPTNMGKFSEFLDGLVTRSGYQTIPRAEIRARLQEKRIETYRECYDEACQIELGKDVAANKVLNSTWAELGGACSLTLRVYDLRTGVTEFSTEASGNCDEAGLRKAIDEVGLSLRSRKQGFGTFQLDLRAGAAIKNPPTDESGYLKLEAEAKGHPDQKIEVWINGNQAGSITGGLFTKDLPVGRYVVLLRTAGGMFEHKRFDLQMTPEGIRIPRQGRITLMPIFGHIEISGTPPAATVVIDGQPRSVTGVLREERKAGRYTVVVEAPGYLPSAPTTVTVRAGEAVPFAYALVRNAGGLSVNGTPKGAEIWLDGQRLGTLPQSFPEVDIGDHVVEIRAPGHAPQREIASLRRGETTLVNVALAEKLARLKVEAIARVLDEVTPIEATVYLDGERVGETPWKGEVLAEVQHEIVLGLGKARAAARTVSLPEGREQREEIEVPQSWGGAVSNVRFDLVAGPWSARSGPAKLDVSDANPVRPGTVPVDLFLDGKLIAQAALDVSPNEDSLIVVTARPKTEAELRSDRRAWNWRRGLSLGLTAAATALGTTGMVLAHNAESDRDAAFSALESAETSAEQAAARPAVADEESARVTFQAVGLSALSAAIGLAIWTGIEWIFAEPERGVLVSQGIDPVDGGGER